MPPDKSIPGSVQDWLVRAKGHLALAQQPKPAGAFWEDQCFLAQQAAEKAIKAILVFLALDFPRRHDLDALRNLVPNDWQVKTEHADLATLTEWAVEARYPGDWPDATEADARAAVEQARAVWESIQADFLRHGFTIEETS